MSGAGFKTFVDGDILDAQQVNDFLMQQAVVYYDTDVARDLDTPFEGKIYFTRLPRQCKISIYTTNGELVRVIEHNELNADGSALQSVKRSEIAADVWDLLTRSTQSKRRAASQMFVAKIEAGGASVIRKFSVVNGTARFVGEGE
jgi:hypothetical protein